MRKYFFAGLIALLPIVLTFMIVAFLIDFFTNPFLPTVTSIIESIEQALGFTIPSGVAKFFSRLLALLLICSFILLLGAIARWFFIRNILELADTVFLRIPIVRTIYKGSRDIFSAIFSQGKKNAFQRPVLLPFPDKPTYSLGFLSGSVPKTCQAHAKEPLVSVFAPTAPHPISGLVLLVPKQDILEIDMTNEDALKFLVSCGVISTYEKHDPS